MHLFTAASLKNRALIALVTIVAAVFGVISVGSLKQELMPSVQFPAIAVITNYPGASPEVVNNDVSEPIETALRSVPNLENTTATSSTGASMVVAEFTYGVDIPATEQRAERAISRISQMLPETADPQVMSGSIDDFPVIQIAVTPPEDGDPEETAKLVERISIPEISDIDGVREAQLSGARGDRVSITPNDGSLDEHSVSTQSITDTLQQSGVLIAAGTVTEDGRTLAAQVGSSVNSAEEIAELPVVRSAADISAWQAAQQAEQMQQIPGQQPNQQMPDPNMQDPSQRNPDANQQIPDQQPPELQAPALPPPVTIGEVADVVLEPNPVESIARVNGEPALTIGVTKTSAANTVDVSHAVNDLLPDLEGALEGASLSVIFDQAPYVEQEIETLSTEGLLGLLFAVIVILVFLMSMRATLVTAISIPTSVLLTIIGLNFAEYSLNMLTLGALTISIGRVVDDSIVVIENIKRHLTVEENRAETIVKAVKEVAGAITASTVATMAVFLPVAFVDGMIGELFRPFSFTAAFALAASLVVSLTIVPVLAYWFLKPASESRRPKFLMRKGAAPSIDPEAPTALQRRYRPVIDWTLKWPKTTLSLALLMLILTVVVSPLMKTNFLGSNEQNSVGVTQELEPGTSLSTQLEHAERTEEALATVAAVESVQVTIGSSGDGMAALFGSGGDGTINYSVTTDPDAAQTEVQDQIRDAVESLEDAGEFSLGMSDGGVSMSTAIEIYVTAQDQETLTEASDAVVAELQGRPGVVQVESDLATSRPYLRIAVDRAEAAEVGLSEAAVANLAAQSMQPTQIGQITMDANSINVYLSEGEKPDNVAGVAALMIPTADGEQRLDSVASVEIADGPVTVQTENAVRMVTVSALPDGDDLGVASAEVTAALDTVALPAGATANIGGVMSQQSEAFEQLGLALLAAILIVYVVMVATFKSLLQPLLLLVSVPFAATGAILLLIATGIPLGVASLIGVLMLIGVVVTNAIVLVDLVNQYRERGAPLRHAVVQGSLLRLRPIIMTALATILALTPMGLGITGQGGFISQPLAVVVIGGLLSSTVLTLVVLPTLYYAVERGREKRRERRIARRSGDTGPVAGFSGGAGAGAFAGAGAAAPADHESSGISKDSGEPEEPVGSPAKPEGFVAPEERPLSVDSETTEGLVAPQNESDFQAIPGVTLLADDVDQGQDQDQVGGQPETKAEPAPGPRRGRRADTRSRGFLRRQAKATPEAPPAGAAVPATSVPATPVPGAPVPAVPVAGAPVAGEPGHATPETGGDEAQSGVHAASEPGVSVHEMPEAQTSDASYASEVTGTSDVTDTSDVTEASEFPGPVAEGPAPADGGVDAGIDQGESVDSEADDDDASGEISDELAELLGALGLPVSSAWDTDGDGAEDDETEAAPDAEVNVADAEEDSGVMPLILPPMVPAPSTEVTPDDHAGTVGDAEAAAESNSDTDTDADTVSRAADPEDSESDQSESEPPPPVTGELGWTEMMRQVRQDADPAQSNQETSETDDGTTE